MKSNLPITWLTIVSAVIFRRHLGGWAQVHKMPHAHDGPAVAGRRAKITPRCHSLSRTILRRHRRVLGLLQEKWKVQSLDFAPSHVQAQRVISLVRDQSVMRQNDGVACGNGQYRWKTHRTVLIARSRRVDGADVEFIRFHFYITNHFL